MFQPTFEMENGDNAMINMSNMNNLQMIPFDDNDPEVIARRIKNRERQRRYRARKRQQEDLKRHIISQPSQPQVNEIHIDHSTPIVDFITPRVYSNRNWKKDARMAHLLKQQQQQIVADSNLDVQIYGNQSNGIVETKQHSSGRNWKAEARNKRN